MAKLVSRRAGRAWVRVAGVTAISAAALPAWSADSAAQVGASRPAAAAMATSIASIAPGSAMGTTPAIAAVTLAAPASTGSGSTSTSGSGPSTAPATVTTVPIPPAAADAAPASLPSTGWLSLRPRLSMRLPLSPQDWRAASAPESRIKSFAMPDIQLVELPREPSVIGPPPKRAHHAISIGMEAPKQFLRSMGLDATECATRFRLPSKLGKSQAGDTTLVVSAHLGLGCKF